MKESGNVILSGGSFDLDISDITSTVTIGQGLNPSNGEVLIHNDGTAQMTNAGGFIIATFRLHFDFDGECTLTFGESIVPAGKQILAMANNNFHRWENAHCIITTYENTLTFNRADSVDADLQVECILFIG